MTVTTLHQITGLKNSFGYGRGAYYAEYINGNFENHLRILVEQGHEMGKDGRVLDNVSKNEKSYAIEITGTAKYVKEFEVVFATNIYNEV